MGTKCVVPILPPSYRCRLRRDMSQTDNVTVRVVFQSNKNTEGQNAGIKYIQDRTTAKIRIRKAKLNVRFSGGDRITIHSIKQARWLVKEEGRQRKRQRESRGVQRSRFQAKAGTRKELGSSNNTRDYKKAEHTGVRAEGREGKIYAMLRSLWTLFW